MHLTKFIMTGSELRMGQLVYDEQSLVDSQMYKYDMYLHSRINKYTGDGRTLVTYYNINDADTTMSLGMDAIYQVLGNDSPLRFDRIENMIMLGFSQLSPEDIQASTTNVRNYNLQGEAYIIPGTIMPKENDFFIVNHIRMNHVFQVTQVSQDGLNTDGSYKIQYQLFSTNPDEIAFLDKQTVGKYVTDLQTIGGEDLTPVIGVEDYQLRSRLIRMVDDMIENYKARFYDKTHNCFLLHLNGQTLFDLCGNYFMQRNSIMIKDNASNNIVLNRDKCHERELESYYQASPYKWIERDAPLRYLEQFKYHTVKAVETYPDSTFKMYGTDVDVMLWNPAWCPKAEAQKYFSDRVYDILYNEQDIRTCTMDKCRCCERCDTCYARHYYLKRYDFISLIHDFIHGKLTKLNQLSLYTGDQLFDNADAKEIYLWTPIIIYIIKYILKLKS